MEKGGLKISPKTLKTRLVGKGTEKMNWYLKGGHVLCAGHAKRAFLYKSVQWKRMVYTRTDSRMRGVAHSRSGSPLGNVRLKREGKGTTINREGKAGQWAPSPYKKGQD